MLKHASEFGLCVAAIVVLSASAWSRQQIAAEHAKTFTLDNKETMAGWAITGDVTIDATKSQEGRKGSLKVGPGGRALLRLRDSDESGKVEFWVYYDGNVPKDVKASRLGPRWGLVQNDGKLLAVGILYACYLDHCCSS